MTMTDEERAQSILQWIVETDADLVVAGSHVIRGRELPCWWVDIGLGWHAALTTANDLVGVEKVAEASEEFGDVFGFTVLDLYLHEGEQHVLRAVFTVEDDVAYISHYEHGDWEDSFGLPAVGGEPFEAPGLRRAA